MMEALPAVMPATGARPRRQVWSVGGGKGGIGKSLLTAALGYQLARVGRKVVLVDADLGGANLHTCLGLAGPSLTLGDFICRRAERIEDVLVETGVPGLRLISGACDFLGAANIKYAQKVRVLNRIRALDVDIILMDLGAGTSFNIIDFFLVSDVGILTVVPEPTSIENGYRFIKSALYRRLRGAADSDTVRSIVDSALDQKNPLGIRTPLDLLAAVEREDPASVPALKQQMASFHPRFVVNQVRDPSDVSIGHQLVTACARHLGVKATYAGYVPFDDTVWRCVRQRRLFASAMPDCPSAQKVRELTRALMQGESLALTW
jgi:flagellar biosynthesis protein FlhG